MGLLPASRRETATSILLGALAGALHPLIAVAVPALAVLAWLLTSESSAMALFILGLPLDRFLTADVGGFTVRLSHVAGLVLASRLVLNRLAGEHDAYRLPPADLFLPLVLFAGIATLGLSSTLNLKKSIGYLGWLYFDLLVILPAVWTFVRTPERAYWITKAFLASQLLAAAYGLAQVVAYSAGGIELPFLAQIVRGWPRLNAFHYEPQYYAFFSLQAVSLLTYLWIKGASPLPRRLVIPMLGLLFLSTFLSTSRSGWLGLCCLVLFVVVRSPLASFKRWGVVVSLALAVAAGSVGSPGTFRKALVWLGSAAFDPTEPSSTAPRLQTLKDGLGIARENPFLGVGIGGYGAYLAEEVWAKRLGEDHREREWHRLIPANMWIEMLAETGLIGAGVFLLFLLLLFLKMGDAARRARDKGMADLIRGYRLALLMTFIVMYQFAQTLYRLDTWFLIGVCVALCRDQDGNGARRISPENGPSIPKPPPAVGRRISST